MSFLKSIKSTFKTAQEDFTEGLRALSLVPDKTLQKQHPQRGRTLSQPRINFDAGAELLCRNEEIWKELYQYTDTTAKQAQVVDSQLSGLASKCDKQTEVVLRFDEEASKLPMLLQQLQDITDSLAQVDEACDMVESALVQLENICEEQEFQRNVTSHHQQLSVYKMKKEHELQRYRVQLARSHAAKIEEQQKKKQVLLKERQEAYGEQFAQDVDFFKKHGKPGRLPSTSESEKQLDIADIEIEDDPEALDEFLASTASDTELSEAKDASESDLVSDTDAPSAQIISDITSPDIENSTSEVGSLAKDSSETSEVTAPAESVSSSSNEGQDGGAHKNKTVELTEDAISKDKQSETAEKRDDDGKEMEGPEESENAEKNDDEMEGAQESGKATSPDEDVKEEMEGATDKQSENNEMPSDAVKDTKSDT